MKESKYPKILCVVTPRGGSLRRGESWGFFFRGIKWEMTELERFNPYDPKQSLTFPQKDSNKIKELELEILLVTAD
jgi:hypothetical protein